MRRAVFSAAALVGLGTALSRLLGFARDVLVAVLLGAGPAADAFLVAFRLPGMVRRVLGEGGLNAGLVPIDHRIRAEQGDEAARRFAGEALTTLALGLLVLIALAEIAAPWVVLALAGGYAQDAERLGLATLYLRLMLPLVAAVTLSAVAAAILNAAGKVLLAAFAPGLVAAAAARVMAQPFLARENVRVPMISAAATLVVTWAAAVMLEPHWGVAGIAAGVTIGAFAGAGALALVLAAGDLWMPDERLRRRLPRTAAASAVMALALTGLQPLATPSLDPALPPLVRAVALGLLCVAGLVVFAATAFALGAVTRADLARKA